MNFHKLLRYNLWKSSLINFFSFLPQFYLIFWISKSNCVSKKSFLNKFLRFTEFMFSQSNFAGLTLKTFEFVCNFNHLKFVLFFSKNDVLQKMKTIVEIPTAKKSLEVLLSSLMLGESYFEKSKHLRMLFVFYIIMLVNSSNMEFWRTMNST